MGMEGITTRRAPSQIRAQLTVETIFDSTAKIVEELGYESLTTNRIAEHAGFSVGTIYQYFPSKDAVLLAMFEQNRKSIWAKVYAALDAGISNEMTDKNFVRLYVQQLIRALGPEGKSKRRLNQLSWRMDYEERMIEAIHEGVVHYTRYLKRLIANGATNLREPDSVTTFAVSRAIIGVIRSACLEDSALIKTKELEDMLFQIVWRNVAKDPNL